MCTSPQQMKVPFDYRNIRFKFRSNFQLALML